jgi:DNA-binding response OmpR family regulator
MKTNNTRDVLIVDDDKAIRTLICIALTRRGLLCEVAGDGEDALQQMRTTTYAVVLLDLMMPRLDGAEFLKQLGAWQLTVRSRPIVLLMTAFSNDRLPVLGEMVHAVIRKPFDLDSLVALVNGCIEQRRAHEAADVRH